MKKLFTLLFTIIISYQSYSQCEYLGGDMETFVDLTAAFDESGTLAPGTIIAPANHTSLFRLLTLFFAGFFIEPGTPEYEELWGFGLGLNMSDDAFTGDAALQIGGDVNVNLADLFAVNACTEIPSGFKFSYKHIGEGADTLSIIVLINEGALESLPETEEDIMATPAYATWDIVVDSTESEYTTVTVPIIDNQAGVAIDTAASFIIVSGDVEYLMTGNQSHFLIDAVSYTNESAPVDNDMDGFLSDVDCDDSNADINPGATEIPNNEIDEDCDGTALIIDNDMDGFNSDEDCDDDNADINPDAEEVANNDIDEDCDGTALVIDNDMDGFNSDEDCDDDNADINPDATEIANNDIDEDCDGTALVIDNDMDGFNSDEDCDDDNADINPDASEIANNDIDEDCDGTALVIDNDMDGFNSDEDCDDDNADINPDATEIAGNDIDEDCDGLIEPSAVEDISLVKVKIAPNPTNENLYINASKSVSIEILDLNGRSHLKMDALKKNHSIDVSNFSNGIYMIKITDSEQKSQLQKVIIQ